jgi:hypothetical protein
MPALVVTATIPAGQIISNIVDVTDGEIIRLIMPDAWTGPGNLTFQVSQTNVDTDFRDLYTSAGMEYQMSCVPGRTVGVMRGDITKESFIRVRAGRAGQPVVQEQDRTFQFIVLSNQGNR